MSALPGIKLCSHGKMNEPVVLQRLPEIPGRVRRNMGADFSYALQDADGLIFAMTLSVQQIPMCWDQIVVGNPDHNSTTATVDLCRLYDS